jgi:hypothetical protein
MRETGCTIMAHCNNVWPVLVRFYAFCSTISIRDILMRFFAFLGRNELCV